MADAAVTFATLAEVAEALAQVLQGWPLYRTLTYSTKVDTSEPPQFLQLLCSYCKKEQYWQCETKLPYWGGFNEVVYHCRNCGHAKVHYFLNWEKPTGGPPGSPVKFAKVGQYPSQEERIPPELEARLSKTGDLDFYRKALRCRNFNFGVAALSYLRRVVENRMNDLLDLIAEMAKDFRFAETERKALESIKASKSFDEKVTFAAKILPPNLRPGNTNPMDLLHDLASEGIHRLPEDDCIDVFDSSRKVFEYLFRELEIRRADAQRFVEDVRELAARKAKRTKGPTEGKR